VWFLTTCNLDINITVAKNQPSQRLRRVPIGSG
jgi:hypothetical protein